MAKNYEKDRAKAKAKVVDSEQLFHQLENKFVRLQEELTKAKLEKEVALQSMKEQGTKDQSEIIRISLIATAEAQNVWPCN